MAQPPVLLDDNGEPLSSGGSVILDDNGEPMGAASGVPDGGSSGWMAAAGLGVAGLAGLVAHNPALAKKIAEGAMSLRKTSMLSGLAPLKSLLGNVGGSAIASMERGSLAPLKEMLSPATAKEAYAVFKRGANPAIAGPTTSAVSKLNIPGRIMGAFDEAGQNALQRAGMTAEESSREMLQAPLPHGLTEVFDKNPIADFIFPFRKTPYNALTEGLKTLKPQTVGQGAALAESMGSGALVGAEAEDPKTIGVTTALHGRYGLPHAAAAGISRVLTGGNPREAKDVVDAASDFGGAGQGVLQMATHPLDTLKKTVTSPALMGLLEYLGLKDKP